MAESDRHDCQAADQLYAQGCYVVFFDERLSVWVLAQPHLERWYAWHHDSTQPHPLVSRNDDDYPSCAYIDFCPWCGTRLSDPALTAHRGKARKKDSR